MRRSLQGAAGGRPRLSVLRSSKHIYAQVIDDAKGQTRGCRLDAWRRTSRPRSRPAPTRRPPRRSASSLAERAIKAGVDKVVFDRGGYSYHGRIKALADGAREGGLSF